MNRLSKKLVFAGVALLLVSLVSFPFIRQSYVQSRRDREFKKLHLPSTLTFVRQTKFGDLIDSSSKEYGWRYTYSITSGKESVLSDVVEVLKKANYAVDVHDERSFSALNDASNLRIDGAISQYDSNSFRFDVRGIR